MGDDDVGRRLLRQRSLREPLYKVLGNSGVSQGTQTSQGVWQWVRPFQKAGQRAGVVGFGIGPDRGAIGAPSCA